MNDWVDVAAAAEVGSRPVAVQAGDRSIALIRPAPSEPISAYLNHCPHRLVPLTAGTIDGGVLRCRYHGWEFGPGGACVAVPSADAGATPPPRAHLTALPVRETDGRVHVSLPAGRSEGILLTNLHPALARAWHPVGIAVSRESTVTLLGREWSLDRPTGAYGLIERWGLLWLAPSEPLVDLFDDPDVEDADYVGAWLPPARTNVAAGIVADNFLDVAHFPFVHAGTFGADEEPYVPPYEVTTEPYGCRSIQVQWFDNPGDPGVAEGIRPLRQRRRATYVYRAPFQLMLRLEELDAGAVKTILFFAQPETLTSTRIYTKMLLHGIGGVADPAPDVVAAEVAFEEAVLAEDLALQREMTIEGLPLTMRTELHVRADRLGVTLRRILADFITAA
ncbi:MAG TPA: Rieske 2Fe-2S domain-containing protein [Micromonosporaceae bacterium]|jgi:phenylpropionate dioxygenase-like ring-hydroxylating dioxygenase large terminal subunit